MQKQKPRINILNWGEVKEKRKREKQSIVFGYLSVNYVQKQSIETMMMTLFVVIKDLFYHFNVHCYFFQYNCTKKLTQENRIYSRLTLDVYIIYLNGFQV